MEKIKYKQYTAYKILITIVLAIIIGTFVTLGNFIVSLAAFLVAILLMMILRKNVDAKLTDERMDMVGGKAARIVMTVSALLMAAAGIILISLRNTNHALLTIGNVLVYTECGMMLFYSILFKYYAKRM
jgi:uncharacterized membrane protein